MPTLNLFPARVAIGTASIDGRVVPVMMTPEFFRAMSDLLQRVGGPNGVDTGDIEEIANEALQNSLDALLTQAAGAQAAIAEALKAIDSVWVQVAQGLAGLSEAEKVIDGLNAQIFQSVALISEIGKRVDGLDVMAGYSDQQRVNWERPGKIGSLTPNDGTFLVLRGNSLAKVSADTPTAQSIPNNTLTKIVNWTVRTDVGGNLNPVTGIFTSSRAGRHWVTAKITFAAAAFVAGSEVTVAIYKNGVLAQTARLPIAAAINMAFTTPPFSYPFDLAATDTLECYAFQNSGGAVNTSSAGTTYFTVDEMP